MKITLKRGDKEDYGPRYQFSPLQWSLFLFFVHIKFLTCTKMAYLSHIELLSVTHDSIKMQVKSFSFFGKSLDNETSKIDCFFFTPNKALFLCIHSFFSAQKLL